jgi:hypothetical protein
MELCVVIWPGLIRSSVVIVVVLVVTVLVMVGLSATAAIAVVTAAGTAGVAIAGRLMDGRDYEQAQL